MDAYTLLNAALIGLFSFAAVHYFITWLHSPSERLLLAFSILCALCSLFCPSLIALAHSKTVSEAQFALTLRLTIGPFAHASALAFLGLLGAGRIQKGILGLVLFLVGMGIFNVFVPLRGSVTSLEHILLPGGGTAAYPVFGPYSNWLPVYFAGVSAAYIYGLCVASGFWTRDRVGSILIGTASLACLSGNLVAVAVDIAKFKAMYIGAIPQTVFVVCMATFIARKHAERREQLRKSEERLRIALEAGQLGVWEQDPATGVYYGDARSFEIFKLPMSPDSLFPFEIWKGMVDPQDLSRVTDALIAVEKGTRRVSASYGFTRSDGAHCHAEFAASAVTDAKGRPTGVIGMVWDITQRRQADEELRASEERFRLLIEKATDIITVVNRDGIFRFVGPSVMQYLGYEPEELLNRRSFDFIEPQDVEKVSKAIQDVLLNFTTVSVEYRFRHRDGSWRILESIGRNIQNQAPDGFIVVNSRDITESRKLSEHLRQAQKMDAIGAVAGGVAHDFNNLLTIINGRCDLMLMRLPADAPLRRELSLILETGERASNLTRQLLAFSRRQVLEPKCINLNQIVKEMNNMLRRLVPENISIATVLEPNLLTIKADPGQVEQVLLNLVVNARDAMPSGGTLTIKTSNLECDEVFCAQHPTIPLGIYVSMSVIDSGCGMSDEVKTHIFEPFFTTKESGKGTGLGLPTVLGIVQQSNGHITVYSEQGKGANFSIYFPQHVGSGEVLQEVRPSVCRGHGETILVVEDENQVRELAREVLETLGYKVLESKNGEEALAIFKKCGDKVQLVMSDTIMPKMGGVELAFQLRKLDSNIKILILSGYTDHTLGDDGTLPIAVSFLQKPFTAGSLSRRINELLNS